SEPFAFHLAERKSCPWLQPVKLMAKMRHLSHPSDYPFESIFKEFLQNADDAGATRLHVIVDGRWHPTRTLLSEEMKVWQGPAILIFNDAKFKKTDFDSLMQIRVGGKQGDDTKIGKHGLGFNSCYHFTDVPSFISGNFIAFLDPHEKYLPRRERGSIGSFPKKGIRGFLEEDQLIPYEGIEGNFFQSSFEGTLFRIPLRQQPSDISDSIFTTAQVLQLLSNIKLNISSQFLFLRNIETIEVSHIPTASDQVIPIWKAVAGMDDGVRNQRRSIINGEIQIFQMRTELIDDSSKQNEHWFIATGAQQDPEDQQLKQYARRHRLRILGGVAALLSSTRKRTYVDDQSVNINLNGSLNENQNEFKGRMYSFLSLPDVINLPVHINGTWAQSSDRTRVLIEKDDLPDLDHQKLNWNRYILLEFLPKLYCELLKEIIEFQKNNKITLEEQAISKFWPFPPVARNYPKYTVEYGCKVLFHLLQTKDLFPLISDGVNDGSHVDVIFKALSRNQIEDFRHLLRNNWDEIGVKSDASLKTMILSLPIWPVRKSLSESTIKPALKPISSGFILPKEVELYRTKDAKVYLASSDDLDDRILVDLAVPHRNVYSYIFEDVDFPKEYDEQYMTFLKSILKYERDKTFYGITRGLRDRRCFPTVNKKRLKKASDLYDFGNYVFWALFSGSDVFLHPDLSEFASTLSTIGFKNRIDQATFNKCAEKIEEYQNQRNPPTDLRHRGSVLVNYLYKNSNILKLENIERIPFVPVAQSLDNPYSLYYKPPRVLNCFKEIILPKYKEVAWSQKSLIAEDVVPPPQMLQVYPSLGKPDALTVVEHLRFLREKLMVDEEWKTNWADTFKYNVYEVYKWLNEESINEDLNLGHYINPNERLFLNFNKNPNPFDTDNWVSANDLVLNSEPGERKYVNPELAKYANMLKSANVREIKPPNVEIIVRQHNQLFFNNNAMFEFLLNQEQAISLHDVIFNVKGEMIGTSRYMLAASSIFFYRKFASGEFTAESSPVNPTVIIIDDAEPNSVRILLRYLYGQDINDAVQCVNNNEGGSPNMLSYVDLLKLANNYELEHLKDLMELKLSRLVSMSNVAYLKRISEELKASQLEKYCNQFIIDHEDLR
ncbi:17159_t:CDS:2, partial [Acaulospora morrowiae]